MNTTDKKSRPYRQESTEQLLTRSQQIVESLFDPSQILRGSLITRNIKCGKSACRCSTGEGHPSFYLSTIHQGRTRLDYVPASWEPWVRERLDNYHILQELIVELTEINLELLRRREKSEFLQK
ncbi:hypothetical protein LSG31_08865 [Fodinisporobacter ferrooxydans]|uniref:DUF6788 domain-containing protein n=1 Tax=Fodinisporobacter ferrooxydans TaxID=2901836 RepID=A0ABY4CL88_9BACL|nr:hypothetical protein LSG31_18535 [Alicyclobacillaceae bacterium MYW30-H2]UOF91220.1 hypothetical protein LSG31_02890 [Alicyclobacillaceae bacterium MYW30-H2]UOF91695.1 hypothetical protein LSG31_05455 [Alicyclobacillaceae bacterium MYW30-H2]UOF92255.1 hypothetical protein LSG31_08865 [Alicyclobacillaceae bacterium MYW30-H2]